MKTRFAVGLWPYDGLNWWPVIQNLPIQAFYLRHNNEPTESAACQVFNGV
jgi:hypothetical protein